MKAPSEADQQPKTSSEADEGTQRSIHPESENHNHATEVADNKKR